MAPIEEVSDLVVDEHVGAIGAHGGLIDRSTEPVVDFDQVGEQVAFEVGADASSNAG